MNEQERGFKSESLGKVLEAINTAKFNRNELKLRDIQGVSPSEIRSLRRFLRAQDFQIKSICLKRSMISSELATLLDDSLSAYRGISSIDAEKCNILPVPTNGQAGKKKSYNNRKKKRSSIFNWNESADRYSEKTNFLNRTLALSNNLTRLRISNCVITSQALRSILILCARSDTLEEIGFEELNLKHENVFRLACQLEQNQSSRIKSLNLNNNNLSDACAVVLARKINQVRNLEKISLCANKLQKRGMRAIVSSLVQKGEHIFDFRRNPYLLESVQFYMATMSLKIKGVLF